MIMMMQHIRVRTVSVCLMEEPDCCYNDIVYLAVALVILILETVLRRSEVALLYERVL